MEGLKEFLTPTRFSLFGYMVAIVYFFAGVVFVGITSKLRLNERRTFLCDFSGAQPADKLILQAQCFDKYDQHYNTPLPLYVFVLLNFSTVIVVCLVYSWCFVKSLLYFLLLFSSSRRTTVVGDHFRGVAKLHVLFRRLPSRIRLHFFPETGIIECHRKRFVRKKRTYHILSQLRCV